MKKLLFFLLIPFIGFSQTPITQSNINNAVDLWISNQTSAEAEYGHISNWDTSNVTDMSNLFSDASSFNQDIGSWDVSNVTTMSQMFYSSTFNGSIGSWDVSNVANMSQMFRENTAFNQDIDSWDVSSVTNMYMTFLSAASFNQDISSWNVSSVETMYGMFGFEDFMVANGITSSFNQDIGSWNTSNVTDMGAMFYNASSFNQDIGNWDVSSVQVAASNEGMGYMFNNSGLSTNNYDNILIGWSEQNVNSNIELGAEGLNYCNGEDARQSLIDNYGWTITDAGYDCSNLSLEENTLDVSIYPNPTTDFIFINSDTELEAVVYDILGKQVMREYITDKLDISCLEKGTYIINLTDGVNTSSHKIIKH